MSIPSFAIIFNASCFANDNYSCFIIDYSTRLDGFEAIGIWGIDSTIGWGASGADLAAARVYYTTYSTDTADACDID